MRGYDGVEIIGSAGYLISTFLVEKTNRRTDRWGGSFENRMRFPVEIVKRVRAAVGPNFILIFRISAMDMLEGGLAWEEVVALGKAVVAAGVNIVSTHFCWHEAFVPTIATMVPRAAFTQVTGRLRKELGVPMITSNRINMPQVAEDVLARGDGDIVSMARPMLADPELVRKAAEGREDEINTCIACNQACLDHTFTGTGRELPRQSARLPRDRTELPAGRAAQAHRRRRRGTVGPRLRDHRGRARPQGDAVRFRRAKSAASSISREKFPARKSSTRRCAISAAWSTRPASICA